MDESAKSLLLHDSDLIRDGTSVIDATMSTLYPGWEVPTQRGRTLKYIQSRAPQPSAIRSLPW